MNKLKKIGLFVVLVDFLSLTAYAFVDMGAMGILEAVTANTTTILLSVDVGIALVMISVWMWRDARARGKSALPYLVVTGLTGSAGPLLYLLMRDVGVEEKVVEGRAIDALAT